MTTPLPPWRKLRIDGPYTVIQVDVGPGQVAELMVRNDHVGTADMEASIRAWLARHAAIKGSLEDFS